MNDSVITTHIYKTSNSLWCFENVLTDVLPDSVNTFCDDFPKHLAWKNFMYYLNHSSPTIKRIKDRTNLVVDDTLVQSPH